jgi:hypothetical protein
MLAILAFLYEVFLSRQEKMIDMQYIIITPENDPKFF